MDLGIGQLPYIHPFLFSHALGKATYLSGQKTRTFRVLECAGSTPLTT